MISFLVSKLRKNTFAPLRSFFSFSIAQTVKNSWKKLVKQIGENIMNLLLDNRFWTFLIRSKLDSAMKSRLYL